MQKSLISALLIFFMGHISLPQKSTIQVVNSAKFGISNTMIANMDATIQKYVDEQQVAGAVVLMAKEGEIFYARNVGMQDIENNRKMELNSSFQIASMTKPITTVALLMLMEEGKIKLDDPIVKYLPAFKKLKVLRKDGTNEALKTPLTIKHFLMHTTGLPNGGNPVFREKVDMSKINSLKEYVDAFAELPLLHQPEEEFTYAINTNVIGRVIEIVSGQAMEEFFKERIFEPLGMNQTYYFIPEKELHRFASIYKTTEGGLKLIQGPTTAPLNFARGNGGLSSTAQDYFRFAQMLLNGGELNGKRLIRKETVELMTSNLLPEEIYPLNVMGALMENTGFGLGLAVVNESHSGWSKKPLAFNNLGNLPGGSYYWPGAASTYWWADPSREIVGIVLAQSTNPDRTNLFQDFHQEFYSNLFENQNSADVESASLDQTQGNLTIKERTFLVNHLIETKNGLMRAVEGLSRRQLNFRFDTNRWSIMECMEHIAVAESNLWNWASAGLEKPGTPEQKARVKATEFLIIARLEDRVNRLDAPTEVRPTGRYRKLSDALTDYSKQRSQTLEFAMSTKKDLRNHFVDHPIAGTIDVYMALILLSAHQQRHLKQIEEIKAYEKFPKR